MINLNKITLNLPSLSLLKNNKKRIYLQVFAKAKHLKIDSFMPFYFDLVGLHEL